MLLFEREKGLQSYKAQSHLKRVMVPSSPPGKFVLKSCLQCQVHSSHFGRSLKTSGLKESPKLPTHIYDVLMCTLIKRIIVLSIHVKNNILLSWTHHYSLYQWQCHCFWTSWNGFIVVLSFLPGTNTSQYSSFK